MLGKIRVRGQSGADHADVDIALVGAVEGGAGCERLSRYRATSHIHRRVSIQLCIGTGGVSRRLQAGKPQRMTLGRDCDGSGASAASASCADDKGL